MKLTKDLKNEILNGLGMRAALLREHIARNDDENDPHGTVRRILTEGLTINQQAREAIAKARTV